MQIDFVINTFSRTISAFSPFGIVEKKKIAVKSITLRLFVRDLDYFFYYCIIIKITFIISIIIVYDYFFMGSTLG